MRGKADDFFMKVSCGMLLLIPPFSAVARSVSCGIIEIMTTHLYRRLALLTQGGLDIYRNKTAMGMLRFRPDDVVCVIDQKHVGQDLQSLTGVGAGIPIVGSVSEAISLGIDWLVIGVATPGGTLPDDVKVQVYDAIRNRIGVISGLHESVNGDPNLVALAARYAVELVNLRKVPHEEWHIGKAHARHTKAFRVLVVGSDANIGKTTTALELERHLKARGINARFVPTGQDGRLITGRGMCIDRVIGNFMSGAVEKLITSEARHADILIIEGQDSIFSPPYSGVALSILHGSCPDAMILCHAPTRTELRHTDIPIPPLKTCRDLYEAMLAPIYPGKVIGVALNTMGLDGAAALAELTKTRNELGLPTADVVRPLSGHDGCQVLADAILAAWEKAQREKRGQHADLAERESAERGETTNKPSASKANSPAKSKTKKSAASTAVNKKPSKKSQR
jgi:uncharacterized NAD-dependent epimerase/dehydratase family protein